MQKIVVKDESRQDWIRMYAHLANLFFEQCEIVKEDEEGAINIDMNLVKGPDNKLTGKALLTENQVEYSAEFTEMEEDGDAKIVTRQLKRIYSHIFLEVLEQATGMEQSWGILTGIRPMKLYHKYRQVGYSSEEAIINIMKKYRVS